MGKMRQASLYFNIHPKNKGHRNFFIPQYVCLIKIAGAYNFKVCLAFHHFHAMQDFYSQSMVLLKKFRTVCIMNLEEQYRILTIGLLPAKYEFLFVKYNAVSSHKVFCINNQSINLSYWMSECNQMSPIMELKDLSELFLEHSLLITSYYNHPALGTNAAQQLLIEENRSHETCQCSISIAF